MNLFDRSLSLAVLGAQLVVMPSVLGVATGLTDTFENGTTENWIINPLGLGAPPPGTLPKNVPSGGPGGVDDAFLLLTSTGTPGPGGRLSVINLAQWAGNYVSAGISAIRMDVNNLGQTDLFLRLLLADPLFGPPQNIAFSANAVHVPPGGGWTTIEFPVLPSFLTAGLGTVDAALMNATELRLYHGQAPSFPSPPGATETISALLGVDNIQARSGVVPDSGSTVMLLGMVLFGIVGMSAALRIRSPAGCECTSRRMSDAQ